MFSKKRKISTLFSLTLCSTLALLTLTLSGCARLSRGPIEQEKYFLIAERRLEEAAHRIRIAPSGEPLLAGIGKSEITPPVGTPLGGYGKRWGRASEGVHDPLYARALALRDRTDTALLVSVDLVAVNERLFEAVYSRIQAQAPDFRKESLTLAATHTHSGSGALGKTLLEWMILGRYREDVFLRTTAKIAESCLIAIDHLKPARWGFARSSLEDLGLLENRLTEGGTVDSEILLLRIDSLWGKRKALLVNLTAHPTTLGVKNLLFSADFPGALAQRFEKEGRLFLFFNGALADQRIGGIESVTGFDKMDRVAELLAKRIQKMDSKIKLKEHAEIGVLSWIAPLPSAHLKLGRWILPHWASRGFLPQEARFSGVSVDDILLLGVPGELSSEIGLLVKEKAKREGWNAWIVGLANDYAAYMIPEKDYFTDAYEASVSFYGPTLGEYVERVLEEEIEAFSRKKTRRGGIHAAHSIN